jgi:protein-disulfide isomerase
MDGNKTRDSSPIPTLVVFALLTTCLVVYRQHELRMNSAQGGSIRGAFVQNWQTLLNQGVLIGSASAPVQLMEFSDFECPYCAGLHSSLKVLRGKYPSEVAISYVYFPLDMHRFAIPAIQAAECARSQGRFEAMHDRLFEQARRLGVKPWREFAADSGVPDLQAFDACISNGKPSSRVSDGLKLGEQLNVQGTPTVIINGWKLNWTPSEDDLTRMVTNVLAGKAPV